MNEERRQAYLNLIDSLLTCPSGEENQILQANSELVDAGLVQVMLERANDLRNDYYLDNANYLMTLAWHLSGTSNTIIDKSSASAYLNFLIELLQATAKSSGDRKVIYSLLRNNLKLVNNNLAVVLLNLAIITLPKETQKSRISIIGIFVNFCLALDEFPLGSRANNSEIAIAGYEISLKLFTRHEDSKKWAMTQNNLGLAYCHRIRGETADNLEKAISSYGKALSVFTREAFPEDWAMTQNNLGSAYRKRIRGEKADNLEKAIALYQASLEVYTRKAFPQDWAWTQNNLAVVYSNRIKGEKSENLEMAISACEAALEIRSREAFPQDWANTQNNLAGAYFNRIRGEKADNLETAISAYEAALKVYTSEAFPINNAGTLSSLGCAYQDNSQLPEAYNSFKAAIETVESMRSKILVGGEADRQKLAEEWNKLYQQMVKVCLAMENKTAALEYVERSKTRNLVELFHNSRNLPQNVQRISFQEIQNLLGEDEAILEWYITFDRFKVFIITSDSIQPDIWQSSRDFIVTFDQDNVLSSLQIHAKQLEELERFQQEYIDDYIDQPDNWNNQLETRLQKLSEILQIDDLISRIPEKCQRLILIPCRYLHLFPLHALTSKRLRQNVETTGNLLELFPGGVRYTPSCQLLQLFQRLNPSSENASPSRFFAIQNPTEDLDFTEIEVEAIAKSFNPAEILSRQQASKTALQQQLASLQNADIVHFSCHGFFDFLSPQKSSLILAGAKIASDGVPSENKSYIRSRRGETFDIAECLTLEEIFDLQLSKCSLVVLSACETGLTDIQNTTDEYIGLPSGFLYAGATSVLSTLWAVNDVSTAILAIKFYELFRAENPPAVAVALRESQLWLRSLTVKGLLEWVETSQLLSREHKQTIQDRYRRGYKQDYQPYESPVHWAAFCAVGQ
jgi:CHAT domain-containing protein